MNWVQNTPWMPELWSGAQIRDFLEARIAAGSVSVSVSVSVRRDAAGICGFSDVADGWLHCLYVADHARGQGVGQHLLDAASAASPEGLHLWTFAANLDARRFYARAGFVETAGTPGDNDEGLPDIQMYRPGGYR